MENKTWKQPPYCTTLMGCLQGAFDYYGSDLSPAMLYGLTGHAFLINIHKEICPSGPYVWKHRFFYDLTEKLGIRITESPLINRETPKEVRKEAVKRLASFLEGDNPCMVTCLEHQLVKEKRGEEITLHKPWKNSVESQFSSVNTEDFSPCLGKAGFLMFGYFEKVKTDENPGKAIHRALLTADDMFRRPEEYQSEGYQTGFGAYENWITALQKEKFDEQGHWWNSMVWAECRKRGSEFFEELTARHTNLDPDTLKSLTSVYQIISDRLSEAGGKDPEREKKIILLTEALEMEYEAQFLIERLLKG